MRIYLAAPFFSPAQLETVIALEAAMSVRRIGFFSPRSEGIVAGKTVAERKAMAPIVFSSNCLEIDRSDGLLAVIDDRDQGVTWEIGYAYARAKRIATYTSQNYGLNVMISECVSAHLRGMTQLEEFLDELKKTKSMYKVSDKWRGAEAAT
jgi:nucleoside 2-deoxyribosyltransferase